MWTDPIELWHLQGWIIRSSSLSSAMRQMRQAVGAYTGAYLGVTIQVASPLASIGGTISISPFWRPSKKSSTRGAALTSVMAYSMRPNFMTWPSFKGQPWLPKVLIIRQGSYVSFVSKFPASVGISDALQMFMAISILPFPFFFQKNLTPPASTNFIQSRPVLEKLERNFFFLSIWMNLSSNLFVLLCIKQKSSDDQLGASRQSMFDLKLSLSSTSRELKSNIFSPQWSMQLTARNFIKNLISRFKVLQG